MCVTASMHAEESKHRRQLAEPVDADLRRTERHADAIAFVEHPVRQLAAQIRPLERVDARQRLAAPERRDLQCSSEQRMPAVGNGRKSKTVRRMSVAGRGGRGKCTDRRRADRASASPGPAGPSRSCRGACPSGRPPAKPGPRSEPGSSAPQRGDHRRRQLGRDRCRNPHPRGGGEVDLDCSRGHSGRVGTRRLDERQRRKAARRTTVPTIVERRRHDHLGEAAPCSNQLPPPAVDQARTNVRSTRDLRNNRSRRERCRDDRLLLLKAEPPPPFGAGENMNLRHTHRLLHRCKHRCLHQCQDKPYPQARRKTAPAGRLPFSKR